MNEIDLRTPSKTRAEDALPPTFHPSPLAADMLQDRDSRTTALEYVAETLGEIRLAADLIASPANGKRVESRGLAETISVEATRLQRLVRALATGALALALVTVALVAGPTTGRAEAMEAPQSDPIAVTAPAVVSVSLSAARVTVRVPVRTVNVTPGGYHCAALYGPVSVLGRACSLLPTVTVPVVLGRFAPLGRTAVTAVDDVAPWTTAPARMVLDVRRPSRFGTGTFLDMGRGDLYVYAPLTMYSAPVGRYIAQQYSPVQVQVAGRHGFRTVATLTTTRYGVASGIVHLGGGVHVFRVVRPAGVTVWSTVGTTHRMNLLTEPVDVV